MKVRRSHTGEVGSAGKGLEGVGWRRQKSGEGAPPEGVLCLTAPRFFSTQCPWLICPRQGAGW